MKRAASRQKAGTDRSVLDTIVTALTNEQTGSMFLEECASLSPGLIRKVPVRYQLIAYGFANGLSLDELNELLNKNNCARLYSRSVWEASLIYAFNNRLSYDEWKDLRDQCARLRERKESRDTFFSDSRICLKSIKDYLDTNSDINESTRMGTRHLTGKLENKIASLSSGKGEFKSFLTQNVMLMSSVREKSRYYFCKYLYYYLISCIERFLNARVSASTDADVISELAAFKGLTTIKRKKMSDEELVSFLDTSGISLGEIFDAFNYYFFDYVSLDWMEVLLEYYGNIEDMPSDERQELAASLRKYDPDQYSGLSDDEVLDLKQKEIDSRENSLDLQYSLDNPEKAYQINRAGENTIRKYIKGSLDIDRTTLTCFLLFFGSNSNLPTEMVITEQRLDTILVECGFPGLHKENEFDDFVLGFIEASDPAEYLMDLVTDYARDEENFFLYRMYQASRSADADFLKIASIK